VVIAHWIEPKARGKTGSALDYFLRRRETQKALVLEPETNAL
jgi:hypothetical protein